MRRQERNNWRGSVSHTEPIFAFWNNGMINTTKAICQQKCQQCTSAWYQFRMDGEPLKLMSVSGAVG
jgi:hypothetical protein